MTKTSYRNAKKEKYTPISNSLLNDKEATLQAKGLLSIFLSNTDDWQIHMKEIITRSKNGRDAHYKIVNELIELGYFARVQVVNPSNNHFEEMIYIFSDVKQEVADEIESITKWAKENEKRLIIEYKTKKEKSSKKGGETPLPENQETVKIPHTENQKAADQSAENQDINNTKGNKTNLNKTNLNNLSIHNEKIEKLDVPQSIKDVLSKQIDRLIDYNFDLDDIELSYKANQEQLTENQYAHMLNVAIAKINQPIKSSTANFLITAVQRYLEKKKERATNVNGEPNQPVRKDTLPKCIVEDQEESEITNDDEPAPTVQIDLEAEKIRLDQQIKEFNSSIQR